MTNRAPLYLAALAITVPSAAMAQTVTTDCYSHKNRVHCSSTYRPSIGETISEINSIIRGPAPHGPGSTGRSIAGERILEERRRAALQPAGQTPEIQQWRVASLIGNGDCPGAQAYAAATGNPATIARAAEFCGKAGN